MSNWIIKCTDRYLTSLWDRMKEELLTLPVTQSDETPTQVIQDRKHSGSKSYMWVHRPGEFYRECPIVLYEYQTGRDHGFPLEFYRGYKGILVTDSLSQYHLLKKNWKGSRMPTAGHMQEEISPMP